MVDGVQSRRVLRNVAEHGLIVYHPVIQRAGLPSPQSQIYTVYNRAKNVHGHLPKFGLIFTLRTVASPFLNIG